jgi:glycosyltransferase involved in cell wall biosynthesis
MTAYNRQQFIAEAIESVLRSTFQNWELIIVDDGSKDNTVTIAKSYEANDERIKVYINEKNLGDYPNRNKAASYAKGKYLKYIDSDDCIFPEALKDIVTYMEHHPVAGWGISNFLHGLDEGILPVQLDNIGAYEFHYFKHPIFFASPGLTVISRNAFEAVGGFSEKRMVSDFEMWHKLSTHSPLLLMPGNMIYIREHAGQEVQEQQKFVVEYEKIKLCYLNDKSCPFTSQQVGSIKAKRRNTAFKIAIKKLLKLDIKAAIPRLKVAWFYLLN